ncbi:DUF2716 domain-containing protein [Actinomadura sp. NPDC049753]|uniref:DUF2716 domain-containing protein n=1 Tax=Actinomadura sp. NPDC049753 TaxID=3154739 RepID=UPI00342B4EB9
MTDGSVVWARLSDSEHFRVWDDFVALASFRIVHPDGWPGILEPSPSVTWDLARERPAPTDMSWHCAVEPDDLNVLFHDAFKACVDRDEWLYVLDWRHPGYRFWPHRLTEPENEASWVVPVFPDGDYYIFLSQDLSFWTFGHPWEASLCVHGDRLLEAVETRNSGTLSRVLRRNGREPREA